VSKARKFGIESFAESLVPVKDSLEAALAQPEQTVETLSEGVQVTLKQLTAAFERNLLKEIAPAQGDKFDPHLHQAISSIPAEQPANTVVQLLQKGYAIADRTLRPALVVVSAGQG
jgi:molecular chaperone GrpE